jgi:hypothetical protein
MLLLFINGQSFAAMGLSQNLACNIMNIGFIMQVNYIIAISLNSFVFDHWFSIVLLEIKR